MRKQQGQHAYTLSCSYVIESFFRQLSAEIFTESFWGFGLVLGPGRFGLFLINIRMRVLYNHLLYCQKVDLVVIFPITMSDKITPVPPPLVGSQYNMSSIANSWSSLTRTSLIESFTSIPASPCFRPSIQWGIVVGGLLGAHKLRVGGGRASAAHDLVFGAAATIGAQWYFCRREEHDKRLALRAYYETQSALQSGRGALDSSKPKTPATPSVVQEEDVPQWKKDLEKIVTYDLPTIQHAPGGPPRGEGFTIR